MSSETSTRNLYWPKPHLCLEKAAFTDHGFKNLIFAFTYLYSDVLEYTALDNTLFGHAPKNLDLSFSSKSISLHAT